MEVPFHQSQTPWSQQTRNVRMCTRVFTRALMSSDLYISARISSGSPLKIAWMSGGCKKNKNKMGVLNKAYQCIYTNQPFYWPSCVFITNHETRHDGCHWTRTDFADVSYKKGQYLMKVPVCITNRLCTKLTAVR